MTFAANMLEWVFLAMSLATLIVSMLALREAVRDETFLITHGNNGPRKLVADQNVREEGIKVAISAVMIVASLASVLLAPPPPPYRELPQSLTTMVAWIVVACLLIVSSLLSRWVRSKLYRYAEDGTPQRRSTDQP